MDDRRSLVAAIAVAWLLVIARSLVFIVYEHAFFESDQAIVGLMAKHLIEGRAFPLYYYGQTYMLGVDAFVIAPFFLVAGPTVGAMHAALAAVNLAVVTMLIVGLVRYVSLSPWLALVATLPFTFAPPVTAKSLVEAGANIGPFLYVPLLWLWRRRPFAWGAVLAIGFLHREFTAYAVPVVALGAIVESGMRWTRQDIERWAVAALVAVGCWQAVQALAPFADFMGPGTRGQLIGGYMGSQGGNLTDRMSLEPTEWPARISMMTTTHLTRLFGLRPVSEPVASQGHGWVGAIVSLVLMFAAGRTVWCIWRRPALGRATLMAWYLAGVGMVAVTAYVATRPVGPLVDRYLLLALFLPVGVLAAFLAVEPSDWTRRAVMASLVLWASASAVDHARTWQQFAAAPGPDEIRLLADALVEKGVTVAEADYWRAYKLSFLTRERTVVASTDVVRIELYQQRARDAGAALVRITEHPCPSGEAVSLWYLCTP